MSRLLLLHGVGSSRAVWWRMERDLTELGHEVEALDLLGHGGRTDGPDAPWSLVDYARDVVERVAPVDLVVGHSLGAVVALAAATAAPDFTRTVLLEDPPGGESVDSAVVAARLVEGAGAAVADPAAARAAVLEANPGWAVNDAEAMVVSRRGVDIERVTEFLRGPAWSVEKLVAACPVPVHLLAAEGEGSALREPARAALFAELGRRASTVPSGHSVYRDRPALWLHTVLGVLAA